MYNPPKTFEALTTLQVLIENNHKRSASKIIFMDAHPHPRKWNPAGYQHTHPKASTLIRMCSKGGFHILLIESSATYHPERGKVTTMYLTWVNFKGLRIFHSKKSTKLIFTDRSAEEKEGLGAAATTANGKWQKREPLGLATVASIAECESKGISLALYIIKENKNNITGADIFIFIDNTGTFNRLEQPWEAKMGQKLLLEISAKWNAIPNNFNLHLLWFPVYQNIVGNDLADTLANQSRMNKIN
ncbi:hypothetical protein O181_046367 [Austropuccinia psidii MF-1]|uniref:RNase H type-1 domain-containing protein n=1 Tax=Austropuccinia psidii MF-1 TaxID=1389203 RepID=A0A9Q3HJL4_9BASI|nr:hypothetical protein [Austropuccinia psidii MF-1]